MMKQLHALTGVLAAALCVAFLSSGCDETDVAGAEFYMTPEQVTLTEDGETVVLQVVGGEEPFTWSVTDDELGDVSGGGRSVTYTRANKNGANTVRVTDKNQWSDSTLIIQGAELGGLTIDPTAATLNKNGDKTVFSATGGTKPYEWSVGIPGHGKITPSGPNQVIYTRLEQGNNTVIVIDQAGYVAIADVTQPDAADLQISPSSATVESFNGTQIFTAAGGRGVYAWTLLAPQSGTLSSSTGSSTVYTSTDAADDVLALSDGNTTVYATISKR